MDKQEISEGTIELYVAFLPGENKYTEEQIVVKIMNALFDDSAHTIITPYAQEIASLTTQLAEAVKERDELKKEEDLNNAVIANQHEYIISLESKAGMKELQEQRDQAREEAAAYRKELEEAYTSFATDETMEWNIRMHRLLYPQPDTQSKTE